MNTELVNTVKETFISKFNTDPLLVFSPGRINIIGEHTDYNDGFVFPAAVDKGIYVAIQKSTSQDCTVIALDLKEYINFSLQTLKPLEVGRWENYILGVVAEIKKAGKSIGNFNAVFKGDIPAGAGMSSSAALENSIVFSLNTLFELKLSKKDMILISQKAEHNYAKVKCGIMDQYASMFGMENNALHLDCRNVTSKPYKINFKAYQLVLINTNVKHNLSDSAYNERRATCERISKLLNAKALRDVKEKDLERIKAQIPEEDYNKALYVIQENTRTINAAKAIAQNDLETLGRLIFESHKGLSTMYKVSCDELDFLVQEAKNSTVVLGARMMGGGFGGCTINLIEKEASKTFTETLAKAYRKTFNRDCSIYHVKLANGTHIINANNSF